MHGLNCVTQKGIKDSVSVTVIFLEIGSLPCSLVKMRSYALRVGPNQKSDTLIK